MARTNYNAIGLFFFLLIGALVGGYLVYKFKPLPEGKVIANQTSIDSLNAFITFVDSIENLPMEPIVTKTDTVYVNVPVEVIIAHIPKPENIDSLITRYRDSLKIKNEINAWVDIMVQGEVEKLEVFWNYRTVIRTIETITEKPVYKPIITTIKVPKYVTGHYLSAIAGGNDKFFTFGIDYDLVKFNRIYGFQYRRQGDQNVYAVKIGINLSTLFSNKR
jgi:hypothetical protein